MAKRPLQKPAFYKLCNAIESTYYYSILQLTHPSQIQGRNAPSFNTLSAFMLAIAIWESYLNFIFFTPLTKFEFGADLHKKMTIMSKGLDKMSIEDKTVALPMIAFNKTYDKGAMPFQDFKIMISIRNSVTHNSFDSAPENAVIALKDKGLLLEPNPEFPPRMQSWDDEISTLEVIRWCINTIAKMEEELMKFPSEMKSAPYKMLREISSAQADERLRNRFK